jgi:hypothetical protein
MTLVNTSVESAPPRELSEIEIEVAELERQVGSMAGAGTDFAIRLERRSTTLVAAVEEVRAAGQRRKGSLPRDFWDRTAQAITALTAVRTAARAALRDSP